MASETIKKSVSSISPDVADTVIAKAEATSTAASGLAGRAKEGVGRMVDATGDLYAKGSDRAQDVIAEFPANLSDVGAAGEKIVMRGRQRLHHGVHKQPVEALLLAGAIGYLVGWATRRS